jgi:phosphoinositide-3-kinase regulatory subunit 4
LHQLNTCTLSPIVSVIMGQGYSLTTLSAGSAGIDVPELADLTYEKSLGSARFMKSIRARHQLGLVFVKAIVKPYPSMKLDQYVQAILRKSILHEHQEWKDLGVLGAGFDFADDVPEERAALADIPNTLGYQRIVETSTSGYLVRQFIHSSLYDRMR